MEVTWQLATCSWFEYDPGMGMAVRISLGQPRWANAPKADAYMRELTPRGSYFRAPLDEFTDAYIAQLTRFGVPHLAREFAALSEVASGEPLVLLCFERLDKPGCTGCHRRTFARWWEDQIGQEVPELGKLPPDTLL